jgi:hypothetical protein
MELHRRKGEVLLCLSEPNRAKTERCFRQAMAVVQAQRAALWELRGATSLTQGGDQLGAQGDGPHRPESQDFCGFWAVHLLPVCRTRV